MTLSNGMQYQTVYYDSKNFEDFLFDTLGFEAVLYFRDCMRDEKTDFEAEHAAIKDEMLSYERTLDGYCDAFYEIKEAVKSVQNDILRGKRLDRNKLFRTTKNILTEINNVY